MRQMTLILVCALTCILAIANGQAPSEGAASPVQVAFESLQALNLPGLKGYPPLARIAKVQGTVGLTLLIDAKGRVERAEAVSGPELLRPAAEALGKGWIFRPFLVDGLPARVHSEWQVPFRLKDIPGIPLPPMIRQVVIEVEAVPSKEAVLFDSTKLWAAAKETAIQLGLTVVHPGGADPAATFLMRVQVQALRVSGDLVLQNIQVFGSLLADRDLTADIPGTPARLCRVSRVLGQPGEAIFLENLAENVKGTVRELVMSVVTSTVKSPGGPSVGQAPGTPRQLQPSPVDFDFSQIRIKFQPVPPPYPSMAKSQRIQGTAVVEITVDPTGRPIKAEGVAGPYELLASAIQYALDWRFEPARLNGVPQYARFKLTMPYRLR